MKTVSLVAAALAASTLAAAAQDLQSRAQEEGLYVVVANDPPFVTVTPNGEMEGLLPDITRAVMDEMEIETINVIMAPWRAMVPGVQAGRFDMAGAGLFMNAPRCAAVAFTEPVMCDSTVVVTQPGNPKGIEGFQSFADDGELMLAIERGTAEETRALDMGIAEDQFVSATDQFNLLRLVAQGRADAAAFPSITVGGWLERLGENDLTVITDASAPAKCAGMAVASGETAFRDAFDEALAAVKESGAFAEAYARLDLDPALALSMTRADFCEQQ